MLNLSLLIKNLSKYFDVSYFLKFLVLLLALYYFNLMYLGITDPKNLYVPFLDKNLNYISWLTTSILYTANIIDHALGINSTVVGNKIFVAKGASVFLAYACLGFGIMSFWIAFIVADKSSWRKKLSWCLAGVSVIWFINCWRISILMLALQNRWPSNKYIDHHDMFNIVAYALILLLIYLYNRQNKKVTSYQIGLQKHTPKRVLI